MVSENPGGFFWRGGIEDEQVDKEGRRVVRRRRRRRVNVSGKGRRGRKRISVDERGSMT